MFPQVIIRKKRDGEMLTREEVRSFIEGSVTGAFADYQISALLMAIYLNGMTPEETAWLIEAMMNSGEIINLEAIPKPKADKHSTGGVGDKVSLVLVPLAASAGLCVPMISGRGLGHGGGTLDKLEAIPGFRVDLTVEEFKRQLAEIDQALIGQTENLVPADKKLYALRDVTATVPSIPLICGSIMSKKLAEGTDSLVLDVKFGNGAFMTTKERARELARGLVSIGNSLGTPTVAFLTNMNQPLGHNVGNALEVVEAIECLKGKGPPDLMEVVMTLAAQMLVSGGGAADSSEACSILDEKLRSGEALDRFRQVIKAQGGNPGVIDDYSLLPSAQGKVDIRYEASPQGDLGRGFIHEIDTYQIGLCSLLLGAGRRSVEDAIDPAVGISDFAKIGDPVENGTLLCRLHLNDESNLREVESKVRRAFTVKPGPPLPLKMVHERIA